MALERVKGTAGSVGRLGHSNMSHYSPTAVVKDAARKRRRVDAKDEVRNESQQMADLANGPEARPSPGRPVPLRALSSRLGFSGVVETSR